MAKKKTPATDGHPVIPVTVTDIAGFIHLLTRRRDREHYSEAVKILNAAARVSRLWASYLPPDLEKIEAELQNGPFDAYTVIGMMEVSRRYECKFRESLHASMRENQGQLNALIGHMKSQKQEAKAFIKECWIDWQRRKLQGDDSYPKGKTQFATDMLTKLDDGLKVSLKTITDTWCREWEQEAR